MIASEDPIVYVERKTTFCAAHRFPSTARSDQGHNYTVNVSFMFLYFSFVILIEFHNLELLKMQFYTQ